MKTITVYTDGSCSGNPGVGGYGAILVHGDRRVEVRGHSSKTTTNNRMELQAAIDAIKWLNRVQKEPCKIEINTDSQYLITCTKTTMKDGSKKTASWFKGRDNEDLWMELIYVGLKGKHKISFIKVKAHSGNPLNEACDKIAKEECAKARHELL